jgi:hypothetical protein
MRYSSQCGRHRQDLAEEPSKVTAQCCDRSLAVRLRQPQWRFMNAFALRSGPAKELPPNESSSTIAPNLADGGKLLSLNALSYLSVNAAMLGQQEQTTPHQGMTVARDVELEDVLRVECEQLIEQNRDVAIGAVRQLGFTVIEPASSVEYPGISRCHFVQTGMAYA